MKFSRRHGDPSRPWNKFSINTRNEIDNSKRQMHGALIDADLLARLYLTMTGGQKILLLEEEFFSSDKKDFLKSK